MSHCHHWKLTFTVQVSSDLTSPAESVTVQVIVAVPFETVVMLPSLSTVATDVSEDLYSTISSLPTGTLGVNFDVPL